MLSVLQSRLQASKDTAESGLEHWAPAFDCLALFLLATDKRPSREERNAWLRVSWPRVRSGFI